MKITVLKYNDQNAMIEGPAIVIDANTNQNKTPPPAQPTQKKIDAFNEFLQKIRTPEAQILREKAQLARLKVLIPAEILANKPEGTLAVSPSHNYLASDNGQGNSLADLTGFQVLDRHHKLLGRVEIKVLEGDDNKSDVLTFIDKGEIKQSGIMDFAMWYISTSTQKENVVVRNILNHELMGHLGKAYGMQNITANDLSHKKENLQKTAHRRLTERGWNLSESQNKACKQKPDTAS